MQFLKKELDLDLKDKTMRFVMMITYIATAR